MACQLLAARTEHAVEALNRMEAGTLQGGERAGGQSWVVSRRKDLLGCIWPVPVETPHTTTHNLGASPACPHLLAEALDAAVELHAGGRDVLLAGTDALQGAQAARGSELWTHTCRLQRLS